MAVEAKPSKLIEYEKQITNFGLEPYKNSGQKTKCPSCGNKSFVNYVWLDTGLRIEEGVIGRCDHEAGCGYHEKPCSEHFKKNPLHIPVSKIKKELQKRDDEIPNSIPYSNLLHSVLRDADLLSMFLYDNFNKEQVDRVRKMYQIGSHTGWDSDKCTVFWQIDKDCNIRTGKIIKYDKEKGKRIKDPFPKVNWFHSILKYADYNLAQCFFGEHLLDSIKEKGINEVHVVESEKTALMCSITQPDAYFVATGGLHLINEKRLLPFKEMKMIFYPDKGKSFNIWQKKLEKFKGDYDITVCDYLEKINDVGEDTLNEGDDLGDYILLKLKQRNAKKK